MTADPITYGPTVYNPLDPAVRADPYPIYAAMRAGGGPCWHAELDAWVITSYRDCRQILRDHETFAADGRRVGETVPDSALSIHHLDPPEHDVVYSVIADALRPLSTPELADRVRGAVEDRLDALPSGPVDLISTFTEPLARWFIPEAIGLPAFDEAVMAPIAEAIIRAMDAGLVPEARQPGVAARRRLTEMLKAWIADMGPEETLRALVDRAGRSGVPETTTVNSLRTLVVNAFTSVPVSLGNALHAVAQHEITLADHLATPDVLDRTAPQEFFRYDAPLQGTTRLCVTDTEISGVRVRRGDAVLVLFAAANRDPERFPDPDRLVLERSPNPHLSFGHGAHACTGLMLAQLMLREVLFVLARRRLSLRPAGAAVHHPFATVRALATLPVELVH